VSGLVDERFEMLSLAGVGGMGRVFRATDLRDQTTVALKVLRQDLDDPDAFVRFRREIDALVRLEHPAIVRYVAHGTTREGAPYLAMRWVDGEELRQRLKRAPLDVPSTVSIATRLADALGHAHARGIMHRDVKPSNVLLREDSLDSAMLIDFGLARSGADELTRTGALVGTPTYMAPEQIRSTDVSPAVDVFALGCVIYECLAGVSPFAAKGSTAVLARVLFDEPVPLGSVVDVPASLAELVDGMLRKPAGERPTMKRVVEVLEGLGLNEAETNVIRARHRRDRLGVGEQRVVSVIVAGDVSTTNENDTLRRAAGLAARVDLASLSRIAMRFDGDMRALPNGTVVVMFTTSSAPTDLAARAAECALELKRHLLEVPLALATGRAEAGSGVPMGEAIDRAVALHPTRDGVRIDNVTAALLDARFVHEPDPQGPLLRGKRETGAVRTLLGKPTPCVGRDAELAMLEGIVAQSARESIARAVIVTAPAGVGKSRIRHELLGRMTAGGVRAKVWLARGDSVSGGGPFGMAAQMIRQATTILEGEPEGESRAKLSAATPSAEARVSVFLGEIVQARFPDADDIQLQAARRDPMLMGDQMQRAFVDFIDAACQAQPLVIIVEDLQWGDLPSVTALDTALRVCAERPLTVIGLARPEVSDIFPRLWVERGVQPIPLTPLSKRAAENLVREVLAHTPNDVVERIVDKAAGNAFYLEELIRGVFEGRVDMPATIVAMVQSRLAALDGDARRILRAASVFGETFWEGSVRALLDDDAAALGQCLDDLVRRELLTRREQSRLAGEVEYAFRHALVREGAYAMLTDADRVLGHRLAAEWLEQVGEGAAVVVAEHFAKGEDPRAVDAYLRAAEQALEGSDLGGAIERAQRGVDLGAAGQTLGALLGVQAQAHHWRGETVDMERTAAAALQLLPRGDARWADAMTMLAVAKQRLGHTGDLASVAARLLGMLSAADGNRAALARAGGRVASLLFFAGRQELATSMLDVAEVAARGGGAELEARIHQARSPHARQAGRPAEAMGHAEAAEAAFTVAGDQRHACMMAGIRGFALSELGAYADAERVLGEALAMAERLGLAAVAAGARSNLGVVFLQLGRVDEAEAIERDAIVAFASHDQRQEGGSRVYLAMILRDKGDLDLAEREARHALELLEAAPALRPLAGAVLATILLALGRTGEALETTREAMQWLDAGGNVEEGDALLRLTLARALVAVGDRAGAHDVITEARARLLARADTIDKPPLRKTFLENVPQHAMTMKLAAEWTA
jgi:tetratricopeptide (TPR) repeat protein